MRLNNSGNLTTSMMILEKYVCRETITDELGSRALSKYRGSHWLPEILQVKEERGVTSNVTGSRAGCLHKRTVVPRIMDLHPAPALRWSLKLSSTPVQILLVHSDARCCRCHIKFCTRFMYRVCEAFVSDR
jgi:hypothetical protein